MDFQKFVDSFYSPTCVVSVKKTEDVVDAVYRIVAANSKYLDLIGIRMNKRHAGDESWTEDKFIPDSVYTDYLPKNRNFEDACYRAAVEKTDFHTYAHINNVDIWFDISVIPLDIEDGDVYYCSYTTTPSKDSESILDTMNNSATSNDVLKTCIKLHNADNLKDAMGNVIYEIRKICDAEGCTVLLLNYDEKDYSILATDYIPGSSIKRVTQFHGFYDIANSWIDMIGDELDCIIIKDEADMEYVSRINNPWHRHQGQEETRCQAHSI